MVLQRPHKTVTRAALTTISEGNNGSAVPGSSVIEPLKPKS